MLALSTNANLKPNPTNPNRERPYNRYTSL